MEFIGNGPMLPADDEKCSRKIPEFENNALYRKNKLESYWN